MTPGYWVAATLTSCHRCWREVPGTPFQGGTRVCVSDPDWMENHSAFPCRTRSPMEKLTRFLSLWLCFHFSVCWGGGGGWREAGPEGQLVDGDRLGWDLHVELAASGSLWIPHPGQRRGRRVGLRPARPAPSPPLPWDITRSDLGLSETAKLAFSWAFLVAGG